MRKRIRNLWHLWQFAFAGCLSASFAESSNRELFPPPDRLCTPFGMIAMLIFIFSYLFMCFSKWFYAFIRRRKFDDYDINEFASKYMPHKIEQYIQDKGIKDYKFLSYKEEYVYYKYYYKASKFLTKMKIMNEFDFSPDLEDRYVNARKNYLVSYLVGFEEEASECRP